MRAHTALRRANQRLGHLRPRAGEVKDVGLELDVGQRRIHRLDQGGKQLLRALQPVHPVVFGEIGHPSHRRVKV